MTTTWQIFDTKYHTVSGLVSKVTYGCTVHLESFIDRIMGELELQGDPSITGFVNYTDLTEETIVGWVKTSLGKKQVTAIEASLKSRVTAQQTAAAAELEKTGLPWRQ